MINSLPLLFLLNEKNQKMPLDVRCCWVTTGAVVVVLLLACTTTPATGFQIVDQEQTVFRINGILQNQPQATVNCNPSDQGIEFNLQVQSSTGTLIPVDVTCPIIQRGYSVILAGFIPRDAGLIRVVVYVAGNLDNLAMANATDSVDLPPGAQALLELSVLTPNGWGDFPDSLAVAAMCIAAQSQGEDIEFYSMCGDGPTAEDVARTRAQSADATLKFQDFLNSVNEANAAGARVLNDILTAQGATVNWSRLVNATFDQLDRELLVLQNKTTLIYQKLQQASTVLDGPLQQTQVDSAALAAQLAAATNVSSSNIQKLALQESQLDAQINENLAQFHGTVTDTHRTMLDATRSMEKGLIQLFTALARHHQQTDIKNSLTAQVHRAVQSLRNVPNPRGNILVPYTDDMGRPPASNLYDIGELYNHIDISDIVFRMVVVIGGTTYGIATRIVDSCGSLAILRNGVVGPGARDIFDWIGPPQCDTTWRQPYTQRGSTFCFCALTVTEQRCPLQNNAGVPNPSAIASFLSTPIDINFASGCVSDGSASTFIPGAGGLHGTSATSVDEIATLFSTIGNRVPYPTVRKAPYYIFSLKRNVNAYVAYVPDMANPTRVMDMLIPTNSSYERNMVYMYFTVVSLDYIASSDNFDAWNAVVNGLLPDGMFHRRILYNNFGTAQTGAGWEVAMAAFTEDSLTVSKLIQNAEYRTAQVRINGVTTAISDVSVVDPYERALPGVYTMAWNPVEFGTTRWDISQDSMPLVPHGNRREGSVLLPISQTEDRFSLTEWQVIEGRPFPHKEVDPAGLYQVSIDDNINSPTFGRCVGTARIGGGGLCSMLQNQYWQAFGIFNDPDVRGTILIRQLTASSSFTINVPRGPIGVAVQSACPSVVQLGQSGVELVLLMTNPLATTNVVRVTQYGPCNVPAPRDVAIAGGAVARVSFFTCVAFAATSGEYVEIAANVNGEFLPCSNTFNLSLAAGTGIDRTLAATWNSTLQINVVQTSVILSLTQRVIDDAMNQTHALETAARQDLAQYSWRLPNITLEQLADNEARILELARNASARATAVASTATDFTYVGQEFDARLAQERANFQSLSDQRTQAYLTIVAANRQAKLSLDQFGDLIPQITAAGQLFTDALYQVGLSMINAVRAQQTLDPTVADAWLVPVKENDTGGGFLDNLWVQVGRVVTGFLKLAISGVNVLRSLANTVQDFIEATTESLLGYLAKFLLPILLPILFVGGIALLVWYGPQLINKARQCNLPNANAFSPEMLTILDQARKINPNIKSNAEILATLKQN
jgi:hypothetical protein